MSEDRVSDILQSLPGRISDVVRTWAEGSPDRTALVEAAGTWTYRELSSVIATTQAWLVEVGVRPGDRVMIVCENCRAFVAVLLALAGLDAWPVLVNARLSAPEIDQIREHCGARRVSTRQTCHRMPGSMPSATALLYWTSRMLGRSVSVRWTKRSNRSPWIETAPTVSPHSSIPPARRASQKASC